MICCETTVDPRAFEPIGGNMNECASQQVNVAEHQNRDKSIITSRLHAIWRRLTSLEQKAVILVLALAGLGAAVRCWHAI